MIIMENQYGDWTVIGKPKIIGKYRYVMCKCSCGKEKMVSVDTLKSGMSKSCGHERRGVTDFDTIIGKPYNKLTVLSYYRNDRDRVICKCRCECGNELEVDYGNLSSGHTKSCGCARQDRWLDIVGERFHMLKVEEFLGKVNGKMSYLCKCDCGNTRTVSRTSLTQNKVKSCGCTRVYSKPNYKDIEGKPFNHLTAIKHTTGKKWLFRCDCGNVKELDAYKVKIGHTTSCGCVCTSASGSAGENEIRDYLISLGIKVEQHNRTILDGKEIDLYLPDFNLGIEYNGSAFHATVNNPFEDKHKFYHRDKFVLAKEKNIHLISIFDVDWQKNSEKIKMYLKSIVVKNKKTYARKCKIVEITKEDAHKFIDKYHIQGKCYMYDTIYGLEYNGEILSMMAFGKLRMSYTDDGQYELHRYCVKDGYTVVGGANKLFAHFVKEYSAKYILSYSDNDYFLGGIYERLGFSNMGQTTPRYYWYLNGEELKRETCKIKRLKVKYPKLLEEAYKVNASNKEIYVMEKLGAMQVWRSGNVKWEWSLDK